ncbi:putative tRNA pseudouridine synthase 4 [Hirsutella rhossiliensis]|uniref:tRNA pseudouridine(55) synthase n=1 Tax=Hirsutella rhossiliensis TaxID=111463 RepID=A0A9P8N338_9HYPO|nr:putative tRNA pseudouridine synthase 4 [Hirsutella rhossiliensis]KAH0965081.1 putative tRNA pseudouridine synthase 4 [Hirsutella rhossiliensis]
MRPSARVLRMASEVVRDGVFAINKPCGQSSAQIIRECQYHFNPSTFFKPMIEATKSQRLKESKGQFKRRREVKRSNQVKMGHGGTLDPLATGVLIVGIGSATKMLPQFLDCTKTYETTVVFGASTDTYDRVGRIINKRPYDHITKEMVLKELASFRGKQTQVPPLYSALKMNGKPLYEYAREGKAIPREIAARDVDALEVELVEWYEPGTHNHRWPTEEAEAAERKLAEQVWRVKKLQETSKQLTPEEKEEDDQAMAAHESFKRKFEARQDELITDVPKRRRQSPPQALMSGALGSLPPPGYSTKGSNLVPPSPDQDTPPPWTDEGPPACKIRLTVTSGYYVRSFCHDLGAKLESAGIMAELCRVRQSDFTVGGINTLDFDDLTKGEDVWGPKVANMLARWNGEPEGHWPGTPATTKPKQVSEDSPTPKKHEQKSPSLPRANPSSPQAEKRKRSPAQEGAQSTPRKVPATANDESINKPGRSEAEKERNGIED